MNQNITKIIDQYLSGELSNTDKLAFEKRMASNLELQQEAALQRNVQEGAKRASQRVQIKKLGKAYHYNKLLKWGGGLSILAVAIITTMLFYNAPDNSSEKTVIPILSENFIEKLNQNSDFENTENQYFTIPKDGDVVLSKEGVLLSVPEKAFMKDGKPYTGPVVLQYQEAINAFDIIKSGLSTMSGKQLLETQGMVSLAGYTPEGKMLELNPKVGVYFQIPVDEYKSGMQLYHGKKDSLGNIDWINPEPFKKIPVPIDMAELDFYPVGYEDHLDSQKWKRSKKSRDSLYLSLDEPNQDNGQVEPISINTNSDEAKETLILDIAGENNLVLFPDNEASFIGGQALMIKYISDNVTYPQDAFDAGVTGKVMVNFIVEKNGAISSASVANPIFPSLDKEAMRIVQSMPAWKAARSNGSNVRTRVRLPITFSIEGNSVSQNENQPINISATSPSTEYQMLMSNGNLQAQQLDDSTYADVAYPTYILPSNVMGFWNPQFNRTNLATREFERRIKRIHGTCNNKVLDKYTTQLNKAISDIDAEVVGMGYLQFQEFVQEGVGQVDLKNPHLDNLMNFYKRNTKELRTLAEKYKNNAQLIRETFNAKLAKMRKDNLQLNQAQARQMRTQDGNFNYKNIQAQMYKVNSFTARTGKRVTFNCDALRAYASSFKTNPAYVPKSGSTAISFPIQKNNSRNSSTQTNRNVSAKSMARRPSFVSSTPSLDEQIAIFGIEVPQYKKLSLSVPKPKKYQKLYAYVFADELNSYQRIDGVNGVFTFGMNAAVNYDLLIVGTTENGFEIHKDLNVQSGDIGNVSLNAISEKNLRMEIDMINKNRGIRPNGTRMELDWLIAERTFYKENLSQLKMKEFRRELKHVVFPCTWEETEINNLEQ